MNTPTSNPPVVAWVGLDWADQRHEIRLQAAGSPRLESFSVEQKPEAFQAWVAELRARFPQGRIALALEQSRGAVIYALMNYDFFLLYPIPAEPKAIAATPTCCWSWCARTATVCAPGNPTTP